jgi:hypothetical protein
MDKSRKMEGDRHGQRRTSWFLWKEGVTPSDIRRRLSAILWAESTFTQRWVRDVSSGRRLSLCGIAASLKNGTVKPYETLKEMAAMYRPRREMC